MEVKTLIPTKIEKEQSYWTWYDYELIVNEVGSGFRAEADGEVRDEDGSSDGGGDETVPDIPYVSCTAAGEDGGEPSTSEVNDFEVEGD